MRKKGKTVIYEERQSSPFALRVFYFERNKKCLEWVTEQNDVSFNRIICRVYVCPHPFETLFICVAHEKPSGRTGIKKDFLGENFESGIQ
jgi:hypothetical protein